MGPKIRYGGFELFTDLRLYQNDSFVFIEEKNQVNIIKTATNTLLDFDILDENLGKSILTL